MESSRTISQLEKFRPKESGPDGHLDCRVEGPAFEYYQRLRRLKEYVEQHLADSISLTEAARVALLEEKYFSAFFRKKVGICFSDWLNAVRVRQAIRIMQKRDEAITDIALQVGFQSLRTFERAFKLETGLTPREFKRKIRPC